jgi:hypothetical protein
MPRTALLALVAFTAVSLTVSACSSSVGTQAADRAPATSAAGPVGESGTGDEKSTPTSNGARTAQSGAVDVCSFMTSAQASAINQVTYGTATAQHAQDGYDGCTYANTGTHADPIDIQELDVTVINFSNCYADLSKTEGPGKSISGLGDQAFGYQIGIVVDVKGTCLEISGLTHAELQGDYTHDIAMAKIIIGELPH